MVTVMVGCYIVNRRSYLSQGRKIILVVYLRSVLTTSRRPLLVLWLQIKDIYFYIFFLSF